MTEPYTHGVWQVKPGRADDFVAAWREFAAWSMQQTKGILWGVLLRDVEDPNRFVGAGAWESLEDIDFWRWDPGFERRLDAMRELVEDFELRTMELAALRDADDST